MPNEKGTTVYALQKKFQSLFGFTLPLFHGRGLLNCTSPTGKSETTLTAPSADNLGLMPYRRRIVAVSESKHYSQVCRPPDPLGPPAVGKPIHVEKCDKPSIEEVMRVQKMYIEELTRCVAYFMACRRLVLNLWCRIWNTYKDEFAKARLRELNIID